MPTGITWCDEVWNPVTGCTPISEGCKNCYAKAMAKRLQAAGKGGYIKGFAPTYHYNALTRPLHWRKPRRIFVCSMGDLFHEDVPDGWIDSVFGIMAACDKHEWFGGHTFFVLTKRPRRMREYMRSPDIRRRWAHAGAQEMEDGDGIFEAIYYDKNLFTNLWLGVSVENEPQLERVSMLIDIPAAHRFVSFEPLLSHVAMTQKQWHGLDWVIAGGESGPGHRHMDPDWARALREGCKFEGIPFHFKQYAGHRPEKCPELEGVRHTARPPFDERI